MVSVGVAVSVSGFKVAEGPIVRVAVKVFVTVLTNPLPGDPVEFDWVGV
jgi:hypothetical protein